MGRRNGENPVTYDPWSDPPEALRPPRNGRDEAPKPWIHREEAWTPLNLFDAPDKPPFEREWLVPSWVPMLETTGLGGPGGEGKTLLAQMLATSAALGRSWLGLPVVQMKAALVLCEDRTNDALLRQADINRSYRCEMADLADNLLILPRRDNDFNRLGIFDRDGELQTTVFFTQLVRELQRAGTRFVVLDTRSDVFKGNQNDEDHARTFIRRVCDRIARELFGCVMLLYQPSKAGLSDGTGMSGSVQWDAAFRARLYLTRPKDAEDQPDARVLQRLKSNYAPRGDEIIMNWARGVFEIEQPPDAFDAAIGASAAETVWWNQFAAFEARGTPVSANPTARNYAPRLFARENRLVRGNPRVSRDDLARVMGQLLRSGAVRAETSGPASRQTTRLVRAPG